MFNLYDFGRNRMVKNRRLFFLSHFLTFLSPLVIMINFVKWISNFKMHFNTLRLTKLVETKNDLPKMARATIV